MLVRVVGAFVAMLALTAMPALAQDAGAAKAAQPKPSGLEAVLKALHSEQVDLTGENLADASVDDVLGLLSRATGLRIVIMDHQFRNFGEDNFKLKKATQQIFNLKGMTLHRFLTKWLGSMNAKYEVNGDSITIVPLEENDNGKVPERVSLVAKEKPLNDVIEKLAEQYDLSVLITPQAGDNRVGFVSARLLNVPPATALEMLALQCELRVVKKGNAYLITSQEHENNLFNEKMDRERQKIELEKFRQSAPIGMGFGGVVSKP